MSVDKLVDSTQLDADLTSVANAIRTKGGTSASLAFPADFVSAIAAIPTGGGSGITVISGSITGNGSNTIEIVVADAPDIIVIYRSDYTSPTAVSDRATAAFVFVAGVCGGSMYTGASSVTYSNAGCHWNDGVEATAPTGNNKAGYTNGKLYIKGGNNLNLWSTLLTYDYQFYYLP